MSELIKLAIYAAIAAALYFFCMTAWHHFTGNYKAEGAALQLAADKPIIEAKTKEVEQWKAEEKKREDEAIPLKKAVTDLSVANDVLSQQYLAALKRTAGILADQKASRTARVTEHETDRGIVLTPQPAQSDSEEIKAIDTAVLDALGLKKGGK